MLVNYKKVNLVAAGNITFKPGVADYPSLTSQQFQEMQKKYPTIQRLVEDGDLEVLDTNFGGGSSDQTQGQMQSQQSQVSISGMKERDAISIIKQTADVQLLTRWLSEKPSRSVESAIRDQLKLIEKAGEEK